jgi:hypothetical protein
VIAVDDAFGRGFTQGPDGMGEFSRGHRAVARFDGLRYFSDRGAKGRAQSRIALSSAFVLASAFFN